MFEVPIDGWYVWIGLAVVSTTTFGVVSGLPSTVPPDASGSARTVDRVAASDHAAVGKHPLSNAETVRIGTETISLRGPGGTSHAAFGYGPVTPVLPDSTLDSVLRGTPPRAVFVTPARFQQATVQARDADPSWTKSDRLVARRVRWEGIDVVLVG